MRLTLITPYRDRPNHLATQLDWWTQYASQTLDKQSLEWIVVDLSAEYSSHQQQMLEQHQISYIHLPCPGNFHKTKALNIGLNHAQGQLIAAFDVDLIPLGETLARHCWLAEQSPHFLVTGYRLMASTETVNMKQLAPVLANTTLGPEDQPSALRKYLLKQEQFGVMPLFWRDRLLSIGGWDETYIGWGAEDQDLIERYLRPEQALCRCHELTYLHLKHEAAEGWNSSQLTARNREHYYRKQADRKAAL